jgi:hypothetical protein
MRFGWSRDSRRSDIVHIVASGSPSSGGIEFSGCDTVMKLFKTDICRFFAIGFAAGAVLVFTVLDPGASVELAHNVVPSAVAAPTP